MYIYDRVRGVCVIFDNRISKEKKKAHACTQSPLLPVRAQTSPRKIDKWGTDACVSVFPSHNRKINGMRDRGLNKALDRRKLASEIHISFRRRAGAKRNFFDCDASSTLLLLCPIIHM